MIEKKEKALESFSNVWEKMQNELKIECEKTGHSLRKRMLQESYKVLKWDIKPKWDNFLWKRKTLKRLNRFVKLNPEFIEISTRGVMDEKYTAYFSEIMLHLPVFKFLWFVKWEWVEVFEITSTSCYDKYRDDSIKNDEEIGAEFAEFRTKIRYDNAYYLEQKYVDVDDLHKIDNLIEGCKEWFGIFLPEYSDKIKYVGDWYEKGN